jgi:AmmeMemoRadiSam system protein B
MKEKNLVRMPVAEDKLYPKDPKALKEIINKSFPKTKNEIKKPFGIIVPAESYKIASALYGEAYALVKNKKYETVVIISSLQRNSFYGISLAKQTSFYTPFGELEVDKESNMLLNKFDRDFIKISENYHESESAIELQLPYIASILGTVKILPVIIGETNTRFTIMLARALTELIKKSPGKFLIVAATNLSHALKYTEAKETDSKFINLLTLMNPDTLSEQLSMRQVQASGGGGVISLLRICKELELTNVKVLKYFNSFEVSKDEFKTDGYLSACVW